MIDVTERFEQVTLLITHYNRSKSLERLLKSFDSYGCFFGEILVSDDGSSSEHIKFIESLQDKFHFKLLKAAKNSGLGNNINKGQDAATKPYTLYVQEDFVPMPGFEKPLRDGLDILLKDPMADYVRFYSYFAHPKVKYYKDGFSEMIFDPWSPDTNKFHLYSDHPHLRRSTFLEKFGRYNETKHSDKIEFDMMISFLRNKGKGYLYNDFRSVFDQVNNSAEPSTVKRNFWRSSNNPFVTIMRYFYRQYIFNYSYFLKKY
jgi:glycosyltransferase involved in cell wall biosynthesis